MKRFNAWLNTVLTPTAVPELAAAEPEVAWECRGDYYDALMRFPARFGHIANDVMGLQLWLLSGLAGQGVRVFAPSLNEAHALAQVDLNVPCSVYRQPFETFVVVYPDGFYPGRISPEFGSPFSVVARCAQFDGRWLFAMDILSDGYRELQCVYNWSADSEETIEDHVFVVGHSPRHTRSETDALAQARRVIMNASMLLTHSGARRMGAANPEYEAKLTASLAKKKLPEAARRANEAALKALPVLYGFDQHVKVYETEGTGAPAGGGGWHVKPHWRRGHWAMLACGAGRKERRRVFRPAVMVHADRFGGAPADTRVTLTTDGGAAA